MRVSSINDKNDEIKIKQHTHNCNYSQTPFKTRWDPQSHSQPIKNLKFFNRINYFTNLNKTLFGYFKKIRFFQMVFFEAFLQTLCVHLFTNA